MKLELNCCLPFVNGLRRALISHVPSFSLNTTFIVNETSYNDDILKLRISMIPVKESFKTILKKENTTNHIISITSSDFENASDFDKIMPNIFLFDLKPNQKIHIECETEKGYGYQNARWQVIQTPIMKKIETVEIKKNYDIKIVQEYTPELLTDNVINETKCLIDRTAVERLNEIHNTTIINFKHNKEYELSFESDYYCETYCLKQAFEYLKQLFSKLEYSIIHHPDLHILKFENRCHTFGNIFQYYLQQECTFASYTKEHYLDNFIILKFNNHQELSILEKIKERINLDLIQLEESLSF